MITPNNKFICNENYIKHIEGPYKHKDVPYPLPSNYYLNIIMDDHKCVFGYNDIDSVNEDKTYLESFVK